MRRLLLLECLLYAGLGFATPTSAFAGSCSNERPGEIFAALEAIDEEGEQILNESLQALSEQQGWTQSDWEAYVAALAETPQASAREEQRDQLVSELFGILAHPPYSCDALDSLEAEILEVERAQWEESIETVERQLDAASEPDYL